MADYNRNRDDDYRGHNTNYRGGYNERYNDSSYRGGQNYGGESYGNQGYGNRSSYGNQSYGQGYGNQSYGNMSSGNRGYGNSGYDNDRGPLERAGDEVRSWFGDDEAERRRRMDERRDDMRERYSYDNGSDYRHNYGRYGYNSDHVREDLEDGRSAGYNRSHYGYNDNLYTDDRYQSGRYDNRGTWDRGWENRSSYGGRDNDRGPLERAGDEVRSWFGDDEAERRRRMDDRRDWDNDNRYGYDNRNRRNW